MHDMGVPMEVPNEGGPPIWRLEAFATIYTAMLVDIEAGGPASMHLGGLGDPVRLVIASPAGGRVHLPTGRMWHTFGWTFGPLTQEYVEEKFVVQGADAQALTVLIAHVLGREAVLR